MRPRLIMRGLIVLLIMSLANCSPSATETVTSTETLLVPSLESTVTDSPPASTDTPPATATVAPSMEVGSKYYYVDGTTLVAVPAGEFLMGADGNDNPEHTVTLGDYWIYSTKVTNQQYAVCVNLGQCLRPHRTDNPNFAEIKNANHPVVGISYDQAAAYCSFVHGRLPTEAEWEKAARNPDGGLYPWGETLPSCDLLNFNNCVGRTSNVIDYQNGKSYYGSLQMLGDVFEWVSDWYSSDYYANSSIDNPQGPSGGTSRSVRSSSFASGVDQVSVANRQFENPENHRSDLGFRCVIDNPTYFAAFCQSPAVYGQSADAAAQPLSSSEVCPQIEINQSPTCIKKLSTTNVGFVGPADSTIDSGKCAPTNDPRVFSCLGAGEVSISASCQVNFSGDPTCPAGYALAGSSCQASASTGKCLAGMKFNSGQGCCVADAQNESAALMSPVCPVGMFYVAGQNACVPNPLNGIVSMVEPIELKACVGGGACKLEEGYKCDAESEWNTSKCCCKRIDSDACVPPVLAN